MNQKILIIGMDSLDPYILLDNRESLPNFSKLMSTSPSFLIESIYPSDSIPAWISIFTGLRPGSHGILYAYDIFDPHLDKLRDVNRTNIKGKVFWDILGVNGYRTITLFPLFIYPSYKVNGVLLCKSPFEKRIGDISTLKSCDVYPREMIKKYSLPDQFHDLWGGYPNKDEVVEYVKKVHNILEYEKQLGLKVYSNEQWDLFFIYFSLLDIIQHRFWRFFDKNDPLYKYDPFLSKIIIDCYKVMDGILGEFLNSSVDTNIIVLSDHGHKSRPINTYNFNEKLRRENMLMIRNNVFSTFLSLVKDVVMNVINKLELESIVLQIITKNKGLNQFSESIYSSDININKNMSKAYLSNYAGIKSYSYGGIKINTELLSKKEYDYIRNKIIDMMEIENENNNKLLLNWIKKREEIDDGPYSEHIFPDILFELDPTYAVGWQINCSLYKQAYDHNVASGGHSNTGVLLLSGFEKPIKDKINLIDLTPTIISHFNIDSHRDQFDGKSIFKK